MSAPTIVFQRPVAGNIAVAVIDGPGIPRSVRVYRGGSEELLSADVTGAADLGEALSLCAEIARQVPETVYPEPEPLAADPIPLEEIKQSPADDDTVIGPYEPKEPTA